MLDIKKDLYKCQSNISEKKNKQSTSSAASVSHNAYMSGLITNLPSKQSSHSSGILEALTYWERKKILFSF